jgi:hypothetical protein
MDKILDFIETSMCIVLGPLTRRDFETEEIYDFRRRSKITRNIKSIFVPQRHVWDCGVASVGMVLNWVQYKYNDEELYTPEICQRSSPLWTIDLFLLLVELGVDAHMYTLSTKIEQHHFHYDWYVKYLEEDCRRVNASFDLAFQKKYSVSKVSTLIL